MNMQEELDTTHKQFNEEYQAKVQIGELYRKLRGAYENLGKVFFNQKFII